MMKKVILIHGYTSSPSKKKYQIISKELDKLGVEYSIPALPGGEYPQFQSKKGDFGQIKSYQLLLRFCFATIESSTFV